MGWKEPGETAGHFKVLDMSSAAVLNLAWGVYCHARTSPDRVALVVEGKAYSYAELAAAAGRVATWMRGLGWSEQHRGPRVGIVAARSFEAYAGILGAAWAGGCHIPVGVKLPAERLNYIFDKTGIDALITDGRGAKRIGELGENAPKNVLGTTTSWDEIRWLPEPAAPTPVELNDVAYIIFTSGTTGVPKGVAVSCGNVAHYLKVLRWRFGLVPDDRVVQFFELTFDVSNHEMFGTWDAGAALYVLPETKVMSPAGFIREHALTVWQSVPSVVAFMMRMKHMPPGAFPSLRKTEFGGEGLPVASAKAWLSAAPNAFVDNQYGPTEATMACMYQRIRAGEAAVETPGRGTYAIGKPYPGMTAAIVGPDNLFLADGETGELALSGDQIALGYVGDEELTARRFVMLDHPTLGRSRWYLSGDMAYCDAGGMYHCLGRIDNQVKINGFRVELEEIEAHLRAVCSTDSVAAVAWPLSNGNASGVVAFVSGIDFDAPAVREQLRGRMPLYMVPTKVMSLESMPLSTNGKVDRKVLRAMLEAGGVPS